MLFRIRQPKELGRTLAEQVPWQEAHLFDVGPRAHAERQRLLKAFRLFADQSGIQDVDQQVIAFLWSRLPNATPKSVAGYAGRLVKALHAEGITGVRTRRLLAVKKTLSRAGTLLRPDQAPPVDTETVVNAVHQLVGAGDLRTGAFVALVWVTRARMADARYMMVSDVTFVRSGEAVALEVQLKEKQQQAWTPLVFVPAGPLTTVVISHVRARRAEAGEAASLFAASQREYSVLMAKAKAALPLGSWAHSLRRGAAQQLEVDGASLTEISALLRHASTATTRRYLQSTSRQQRAKEALALDGLQNSWV